MTYQLTQQDVQAVLESYNVSNYDIQKIMIVMDDDAIAKACQESEDETQQMEIAYDEIAKQLYQQNYITKEQVQEFGNIAILNT